MNQSRQQKQQQLVTHLPQAFVPNSTTELKQSKLNAIAALEKAKALNRPVRMAKRGETGDSHKIPAVNKKAAPEGYLEINAAAKKAGLCKNTFNSQRVYGKIKGTKINNRWFYAEEEIERYIKENNSTSKS